MCVRHHVVPRFNGEDDRFCGHHVIHQLVRADPETEKRLTLKPDIKSVHLAQQFRHLVAFDRLKHFHRAAQIHINDLLRKTLALRAGANHDQLDFLIAEPFPRFHKAVQRIGNPMRAGVADQEISLVMELFQQIAIHRRVRHGLFPVGPDNTVWNTDIFFRLQAVFHHVLFCVGQKGNNVIAVFVAVIFRRLHHHDIGVMRTHTAELNRTERPEVVHLVDQHGSVLFRKAVRRVDIQRIGGGRDHRVGFSLRGNLIGIPVKPVKKRKHIFNASHTVAVILGPFNPKIAHTVQHLFHGLFALQIRIHGTQMGIGAGHNGHIVAGGGPALRHKIRTELHAVLIGTGVMIDINDIHKLPLNLCRHCCGSWPYAPCL